jgi:hypothetical protein
MQVSGGQAPYSWSLAQGALPGGLTLNAASGIVSGTPSDVGTFNFTVQVSDAANSTVTRVHALVIGVPDLPAISIGGIAGAVQNLQQPLVDVALASPYPLALSGTLTLSFSPEGANPVDDQSIQFSTGGRSATFTIPANTTHATFGAPQFAVQTGSVAGTISLNIASLQAGGEAIAPKGEATMTARVAPGPPVIRGMSLVRVSGGFQLQITAISNTRELIQANVSFQPVAGSTLQTSEVTVSLGDVSSAWFGRRESAAFGGQFGLTLPFTFVGDVAISSVSVTLANTAGTSAAASANY